MHGAICDRCHAEADDVWLCAPVEPREIAGFSSGWYCEPCRSALGICSFCHRRLAMPGDPARLCRACQAITKQLRWLADNLRPGDVVAHQGGGIPYPLTVVESVNQHGWCYRVAETTACTGFFAITAVYRKLECPVREE